MTPPDDGMNWRPLEDCGPFATLIGPIFIATECLDEGEPARFGLRIEERHCNGRRVCHGGMLATFLDISLARGLLASQGFFGTTPTIGLTLEFLSPALLDDWIESRVSVLRVAQQLCFVDALVLKAGQIVLRGSGIHKRPRPTTAARQALSDA